VENTFHDASGDAGFDGFGWSVGTCERGGNGEKGDDGGGSAGERARRAIDHDQRGSAAGIWALWRSRAVWWGQQWREQQQ
jgi:hypothetical protein